MTLSDIITFFSKAITLAILLLGIFGFIFKHYIKEWIKAKFKSQLQKENEEYKQSLLRELEAYKASLVRDLEDYKLNIDLKRNLALKYSDKKLEAYEQVKIAYQGILLSILTYQRLPSELKKPYTDFKIEILESLTAADKSLKKYDFYIEAFSIGLRLANLYRDLVNLFEKDNLAKKEQIEKVNMDFAIIGSLMKEDLLGKEHSAKYLTEENLTYYNENRHSTQQKH